MRLSPAANDSSHKHVKAQGNAIVDLRGIESGVCEAYRCLCRARHRTMLGHHPGAPIRVTTPRLILQTAHGAVMSAPSFENDNFYRDQSATGGVCFQ